LKGNRFTILIVMHLWFSMLLQNTTFPTPPEINHGVISMGPFFIALVGVILILVLVFLKQVRDYENHQGKTSALP
jgi:hypothetical protein